MAKYIVLLYGNPAEWAAMTAEQRTEYMAMHETFMQAAGERIAGGEELEPPASATTLRGAAGGDPVITDGPFPETKEALGGFYLIEAADLGEAAKLASMLPESRIPHSGVEIRPVVDHG